MNDEITLHQRQERASGSVLALTAVAVTVTLTTAVVAVTGAWGARQRAGVAADAAALAAADIAVGRTVAVGTTSGEPCAQAEVVARANGAIVRGCVVVGVVVSVDVAVPYHGWEASASARAGPPGSR